jgi:hypothetical protein
LLPADEFITTDIDEGHYVEKRIIVALGAIKSGPSALRAQKPE